MTNEELLKPRYKVIADYPGNNVKVGFVFKSDIGNYYDRFPALFRKLKWWEDRNPEDMPKYLKTITGVIIMVADNFKGYNLDHAEYGKFPSCGWVSYEITSPATEAEYLEYINSNK